MGLLLAAVGCGDQSADGPASAPRAQELSDDALAVVVAGEKMSLILVADDDVLEVQQIGVETATTRARIDAGGVVRAMAGSFDADDQRLELAVDVCPDGLSGLDSEWPAACNGESALHRITVSTDTWTAGRRSDLKGATINAIAPAELSFSMLGGDPLLRANDVSMRFTPDGETLLPGGCGVGDTIYALEQIDPLGPTATTVFDPKADVPSRQIHRYDSTGAPLHPVLAPAEAAATAGLSIECSNDAVFLLHSHLSTSGYSPADNTDLLRLDGEQWSKPVWTGNLGYFLPATTSSSHVAVAAIGTDANTRTLAIVGRDGIVLERSLKSATTSSASVLQLDGHPYLLTGSDLRPNLPPERLDR